MKKKSFLYILILVILLLLSTGAIFVIGYFIGSPLQKKTSNTFFLPFKLDTSKLIYHEPEEEISISLQSLTILPKEYSLITDKYGDLTQHEKTELLKYSTATHKTENKNLTELYEDILNNNFNILIPQQYLDIYFLAQFQEIIKLIKAEKVPSSVEKELSSIFPQEVFFYNDSEIDNITDVTDFSILSKWLLKQKEIKEENTYTTFLDNIYNRYITSEKEEKTLESNISENEYTGSIYFETTPLQLSKLEYMLQFLTEVYSQAKLSNPQILQSIDKLEQNLQKLKSSNTADIPIQEILQSPFLNISDPQEPISLLIKTIDDRTYLAPVYTFSQTFFIDDNNFNAPYDIPPKEQKKGSSRVPIFMYHQIGSPPKGASKFVAGLYVTPEQFEEQMAYLVKNNYKTIDSSELYKLLKNGENPTQKIVMITFDDGTYGQYQYAYPILKKYGLTATFYIVSNRSSIRAPLLKEMALAGMEIASHSATHPNLVKLTDSDKLTYEIYSSKSMLEARTGKPVYGIAYPGCVADGKVYSKVAGAGYLIGTSCGRSIDHYLKNRLSISRVHAFGDMQSFIKSLSGVY